MWHWIVRHLRARRAFDRGVWLCSGLLMGVLISCAPAVQNLTDGQGITRSRGDSEGIEASARVRVLGIAQDGGFPHASCHCQRCDLARNDPSVRSGVSSLGVITIMFGMQRK